MNRTELTLTRYSAGSYVGGRYVDGSTSTSQIFASIQSITGKNLEFLPEGRRQSESYFLYTDTELLVSRDNDIKSDTVSIFGDDYEIVNVEKWRNGILNHYKATAIKL